MKKQLFMACLILALLFAGCTSTKSSTKTTPTTRPSSGVTVTINQAIPINSQSQIQISQPINFSIVSKGQPLAYLLEDSYFEIPFDIQNNNKFDYDNVLIKIGIQSPVIENIALYSYSGAPLTKRENGTFSIDSKSLSQQTNSFLLVGKTSGLPSNLISGEFYMGMELYNMSTDQPIPNTYTQKKLKLCKQNSCN